MALYLQRNDNRSKLQERLEAELREKAKQRNDTPSGRPDGVQDSKYLEHSKQTTSLAWVWALILLAVVGLIIFLMVRLT